MKFLNKNLKGIILCFVIAVLSWLSVRLNNRLEIVGAPVIAIISGMLISIIIHDKSRFQPGIQYTSQKILQYAVILLGFGLNLTTIGTVGMASLPVIISTITTSLVTAYIIHKILKIQSQTAILIGVGSSICGGSAIAATAPVIHADDKEIAESISVIFLFNIIAALLFPTLGDMLGLSNQGFGLFAGTAVNDTSSVTAAASTWDTIHATNGSVLQYATIVKLTRTLAIIPITLILVFREIRKEKANECRIEAYSLKSVFPIFILYFVLASIITTAITHIFTDDLLTIANHTFDILKLLSKFFIVMAMGAIGLNTDIMSLIKNGKKAFILGFFCWTSITSVSLLLQYVLGIW